MSTTEDREYRVTWRSIPGLATSNGTIIVGAAPLPGEVLVAKTLIAAYYRREDDRFVFKRADGMQAFDVAAALVETIEVLEDAEVAAC
jgi:hypothetical protein